MVVVDTALQDMNLRLYRLSQEVQRLKDRLDAIEQTLPKKRASDKGAFDD